MGEKTNYTMHSSIYRELIKERRGEEKEPFQGWCGWYNIGLRELIKRRNGMLIECFNDVKEILRLKRRMISGQGGGAGAARRRLIRAELITWLPDGT